jgi:hypothetical protein
MRRGNRHRDDTGNSLKQLTHLMSLEKWWSTSKKLSQDTKRKRLSLDLLAENRAR